MIRNATIWAVVVCVVAILAIVLNSRRKAKNVWETTPGGPYLVTMTASELACEHPRRAREYIRWDDIEEITLITTSQGPFLPDEWYVFSGKAGKCTIPSEAKGFSELMADFDKRFPGMDYQAIIKAGTSDSERQIWKR